MQLLYVLCFTHCNFYIFCKLLIATFIYFVYYSLQLLYILSITHYNFYIFCVLLIATFSNQFCYFHLNLINKYPQISRNLLSIHTDFSSTTHDTSSDFQFPHIFSGFGEMFRGLKLPLVSQLHSCSCGLLKWQNPLDEKFFASSLLIIGLIFEPRLGDLFVSQNPRELYVSHFPEEILVYAYTICQYSQILILFTI